MIGSGQLWNEQVRRFGRTALVCALGVAAIVGCGRSVVPGDYDMVIANGRVIDPETGLDAVRHVGIASGVIRSVSERPLRGSAVIDANGLVVAPGFVDLHVHGHDEANARALALDGVTTALELELGPRDVDAWYAEREGRRLINYGAAVGQKAVRLSVIEDPHRSVYGQATETELAEMLRLLDRGLKRGALALGWHLNTTPGATQRELLKVFKLAAEHGAMVVPDIRYIGSAHPQTALRALLEVLGAAATTGASVHVCHICSTATHQTAYALNLLSEARERGIDVTTECHPYTVAAGDITDTYFDEGFQQVLGVDYHDLVWVGTGERLTKASFEAYRQIGGPLLIHMIPEEAVRTALPHPLVIIMSDGSVTAGEYGYGHPRSVGSHARVLGHWVRDEGVLELVDAIRKMTLLPAQRLETRAPDFRRKGRIQVGADADLVIFDAERVAERATFTEWTLPPTGIEYVLVNGVVVVREGEIQESVMPGRGVRAPITEAAIEEGRQ